MATSGSTRTTLISPFQYFADPTRARPIFNGFIFIGRVDGDPTNTADQIPVQVIRESGGPVTVAQPIRTGPGGLPIYNGSPAQIVVCRSNYSITLQDNNRVQVYHSPNVQSGFVNQPITHTTLAAAMADDNSSRQLIRLLERGGAEYRRAANQAEYDSFPELGRFTDVAGGLWILNISGEVSVQWLGSVIDGVTDDTPSINAAMSALLLKGGGTVTAPAGEYVISSLTVPAGITLLGTGGEPTPFGTLQHLDSSIGRYDIVSKGATIFKVLTGTRGIICPTNTQSMGTRLQNFAIEGAEVGGCEYGLQIHSTSVSTQNVTVNRFPDGVGVEIGSSWRSTHHMLQIRNCGLGLHLNGNIGAINSLSWYGLLIEECAVGLYHDGVAGGLPSISNSFVSPLIEGIRIRAGIRFPAHVTLNPLVMTDTGYTQQNFTAGIVIDSDAGFNFISLYTEAITGPHLWVGVNSKVLVQGGFFEFDIHQVETYTGPKFDVYRGVATFNSARFSYDATRNPNTAIFRVHQFTGNVFTGNTFSALRSVKEYYIEGFGNTLDYTNGTYQERDGTPLVIQPSIELSGIVNATRLSTSQALLTAQVNSDITHELDTSTGSQLLFSSLANDGGTYTATINYTNISAVKLGTILTVINRMDTLSGGNSRVNVVFGTNINATTYNATNNMVFVVTQLVFSEGVFIQTSRQEVDQ